jgi:hypothetical protein
MSAQRLLALAALAAGFAASPPATAQFLSKDVDLGEGFLCCNVRTDGKDWISDSNYLEEKSAVLAVGTPLKHDGFGRQRVHVRIDGKRFSLGNDYSRDLKLEDFARRWIVKEDPKAKIAGFPPAIRAAILGFKVAPGMTREQVLMAVGYPMSSENPSLDANEWKFWLHSFSPYTVKFNAAGRVAEVEAEPAVLAQVFVR